MRVSEGKNYEVMVWKSGTKGSRRPMVGVGGQNSCFLAGFGVTLPPHSRTKSVKQYLVIDKKIKSDESARRQVNILFCFAKWSSLLKCMVRSDLSMLKSSSSGKVYFWTLVKIWNATILRQTHEGNTKKYLVVLLAMGSCRVIEKIVCHYYPRVSFSTQN